MNYGLTVTVQPAAEPVTVAEMKLWLRQDNDEDDDLIEALITAARVQAERRTERAFVRQTLALTLDGFPGGTTGLVMPRPPLIDVVSIAYTDTAEDAQIFTDFATDTTRHFGWILPAYGFEWPADVLDQANAVTITYRAGYGDAADVPQDLKTAIKFMVAQWYENRAEADMPAAAEALLMNYWTGEM